MINLHKRMLPTSAGVEPATSWSPVGRRIQLSRTLDRLDQGIGWPGRRAGQEGREVGLKGKRGRLPLWKSLAGALPILTKVCTGFVSSNFNCGDDVVNLYDSAGSTYISSATEMAIANMMFSPMTKIFVRLFKCSVQTNANDCGFMPLQI